MSFKDKFYIRDFFLFKPEGKRSGGESSNPDVRRIAETSKGLKVTLRASHAGMINGNNYFYLPRGMQNSLHTWTIPQAKPIQIQHDDFDDPIGRVFSSSYIPYAEQPTQQTDAIRQGLVLKAFQTLADSRSKREIFDAIHVLDDAGLLESDNWQGVGEMQLAGLVTDKLAMQKILDGRYQGLSVGQRVSEVYCSICEENLIEKGEPCEHFFNLGDKDKESGKRIFLVIGDTVYEEISYVNRPADAFAQTIGTELADHMNPATLELKDSLNFDPKVSIGVEYELIDSLLCGDQMNLPENISVEPVASEVVDPLPNEVVVVIDTEEVPPPVEPTPEPTREELLSEALRVLFEDEENLTEDMIDTINTALEDEIPEENEKKDAKLSTKKRKSLPGSSFCGPDRSFPVPDCAHYTAALRLLGRYKGPGDKGRIRSCVERKGKAMGCTSDDVLDNAQEGKELPMCIDCKSDVELTQLFADVKALMQARQLPVECPECAVKASTVDTLLLEMSELKDTVRVLREEYRALMLEYSAQEATREDDIGKTFDMMKEFYAKILPLTKDEKKENLTFVELKDYINSVDLSGVINVVSTGICNVPDPEIEVKIEDADTQTIEIVEIPEEDKFDNELYSQLVSWEEQYGSKSANDYLSSLKVKGIVDKDLTLAKIKEKIVR